MRQSGLILGIESSCDETGISIIRGAPDGTASVLVELVASQVALHEKYGGVVPELAAREHLRSLPLLCDEAFERAGISPHDLESIGVTTGPGLKGCLLMGVAYAQGLAEAAGLEVAGVHHIEGHLLTVELEHPQLRPPYLALIVSGAHTELVRIDGYRRYAVLVRTRDDAAGEAFDKSANLLGIPYPGGAQLAALADARGGSRFALPKVTREMHDFSFSGLKTAIALLIRRESGSAALTDELKAELAWSVQNAIVDAICFKAGRALKETGLPTLVVTGGVAANQELRRRLARLTGVKTLFPSPARCMDNGTMIAYAAWRQRLAGAASLIGEIRPRWPLSDLGLQN